MKKHIFRLTAVLFVLALSLNQVFAERVSQEDAALVANNFMNGTSSTASGAHKAPAKRMVLKKAPATTEEQQFYIYENADGEGWVMVAANDIARPILAYSDEGHFRTDNQPANVKHWLGGYNKHILRAEQNGAEATEEIQQEWTTLRKGIQKAKAAVVVSPLIKTTWDQDSPYWNLCPTKNGNTCYTGCVATAMAQVMNYHQWPIKGTGSHSITYNSKTYTANFGTTTYDWANMKNSYSSSSTSTQKTAVATLMYHCGVAVDMAYGTASEGGSGAYTIDFNGYFSGQGKMCAETALTTFFGYKSSTIKGYYRNGETGMKKWTESEWIAMLKEELDASRPIMYAGGDSEGETGHSFVCDGYDSSNKFHFNWGWSGSCDGYYSVNSLVPAESGSGGGNGDYSYDQDVIVGIIPDKTDLPKYNVTWSVKGETTTEEYTDGDALVLPANPANCSGTNGKKFVGWTTHSTVNGSEPDDLFTSAGSKTVTGNITYYAVFATATTFGSAPRRAKQANATYNKVTSTSDITHGQYLIVYETGGKAFDGSLEALDAAGNTVSVTISSSSITGDLESSEFTIDAETGTIQSASGYYIGQTSNSNGINTSTSTAYTNTLSIDDDNFVVASSGGAYLRYNASSGQYRFRYFKSSTYTSQQAIQLYKRAGSGGTTTYSAYSLTCDPPCANTPIMSFANPEVTKTTNDASYTQEVSITGKGSGQTVTYNSSDETIATVNGLGVVTLKGKVGEVTITASVEENGTYCAASAEYTITVTAPPINVTLNYNGTSATLNNQPNPYTLPTTGEYVAAMCSGDWTFDGWYGSTYAKNTEKPTYITELTATGSAHAVYKTTETSGGSTSGSKTFTFAEIAEDEGWLNGIAQTEVVNSPVTITATGGANDGKYYTSDHTWRMYNGGTVSISVASGTITSVTSTPSKTFTINNGVATLSCTETIKFSEITVVYTVSGSSTTYYATTPVCVVPCSNTPSMSFSPATVDKTTADVSFTKTVTIENKGSGQTVAYSSSDETVATVDNSGVVTLQGKVGSTIITASVEADGDYCAASTSYTLNVSAAPIDVTLYYNGTSASLTNQTSPYTLPTGSPYTTAMCSGDWTFAGWYGSTYAKSTTAPMYITELTATGSAYAVYTTTESSGSGGSGGTVSIKTSTTNIPTGYGSANTFTEYTLEGYKFKIQQMYLNGDKLQWRAAGNSNGTGTMYNNEAFPGKITSIVLTYNSSDGNKNFTVEVGSSANPTGGTSITPSVSGSVYTFDCSSENADYFVLTNGTNAGYLDQIDINYSGGGSSTTYYATSPDCLPPVNTYTVTWVSCGETFKTETYSEGDPLVLPSPTLGANAGKSFVGWTTEQYTGASAPTDLFTTAGSKTVTADVTYYAVFH